MRTFFSILITLMLLSGCGNLVSQKRADLLLENKNDMSGQLLTLPAQLRVVYLRVKADKTYVSFAEPGPDAALSDTFKLIAGATQDVTTEAKTDTTSASAGKKLAVNSDFQTSTTAMELAGRTQLVLLSRELLFRTCEYAANGWIKDDDVKKSQADILQALVKMTETESKNADTKAKNADTAAKQAETVSKLDSKILSQTAARLDAAEQKICTANFEACLGKAINEDEKKICRANNSICLK
ncbi:hypothetical protein GTP58_20265 [Duganella sp. CY15W]|uniref:hypothetical protein n=1 Tax=Duganella sp. CY15W TaxID=2692172 RepID=UPI00136B57A5|nr:hypothetical protein [Duganella sp. CY15W]MYM30671.1 hypothetical protein [Duganella sp. CY15W]